MGRERKSILHEGTNQSSEVGNEHLSVNRIEEEIQVREFIVYVGGEWCEMQHSNVMFSKMCSISHDCCRGREGNHIRLLQGSRNI